MKVIKIVLSEDGGKVVTTKIDSDDLIKISGMSLRLSGDKKYAVASTGDDAIYLHRIIAGAKHNELVDHINRDKLDNRRINLRLTDHSGNRINVPKINRKCGSKYKGVTYRRDINRWVARLGKRRKYVFSEFFDTEIEAAIAYNEAAKRLYGPMAFLNEVENEPR